MKNYNFIHNRNTIYIIKHIPEISSPSTYFIDGHRPVASCRSEHSNEISPQAAITEFIYFNTTRKSLAMIIAKGVKAEPSAFNEKLKQMAARMLATYLAASSRRRRIK